jgi:hypothetical protein
LCCHPAREEWSNFRYFLRHAKPSPGYALERALIKLGIGSLATRPHAAWEFDGAWSDGIDPDPEQLPAAGTLRCERVPTHHVEPRAGRRIDDGQAAIDDKH